MKRKYRTAVAIIKRMSILQKRQSQICKSYAIQLNDLSSQIVDMKRRLEESDVKSRETKATSNIKPRMATIILKRRITEPTRSLQNSSSGTSQPSSSKKSKLMSAEAREKKQ